jgi:hypothetical protein
MVPYDQRAGLGREAVSAEMGKAVLMLAVEHPFRQASALLKALTGQPLSFKTIHRLTGRVGTRAAEQEKRQADAIAEWKSPPAEVRPSRLYVATDGVTVRQRDGFKEAKAVVCYGEDERGRPMKRYAVRFESADEFKAHAWSLACRCGHEQAKETVLLGDGAAWIWDHVGAVLHEKTTHVVDWYHALEHVWTCGKALFGEETPETTAWVKKFETWLWNGEVRKILQKLRAQRDQAEVDDHRKALASLITYVTNQDARLAYDKFRERGLDIGSGQIESACKNVVAARMKRSGMCWSAQGAQALLSLRTPWMNGDWDHHWSKKPLSVEKN